MPHKDTEGYKVEHPMCVSLNRQQRVSEKQASETGGKQIKTPLNEILALIAEQVNSAHN